MMGAMAELDREAVFVASSTDGRDFVDGVAGAFATRESLASATALGVDWSQVAERNDSYHGHRALGQLLDGGHTGWNLCDLYVAFTR
jgi:hydroxypyruvate reductase